VEQVLKIASIYTTKLNEKEELMAWWNQLPLAWKDILGKGAAVHDGITLNDVIFLSDSTLGVMKKIPEVHWVDTVLTINGEAVRIQGSDTLFQVKYDTLAMAGTMAGKALAEVKNIETLDLSENPYITDLAPVQMLSGLKKLDISSTPAGDLFPVRNLTRLEVLDMAGSSVSDIQHPNP
jgi:hypothetical protein